MFCPFVLETEVDDHVQISNQNNPWLFGLLRFILFIYFCRFRNGYTAGMWSVKAWADVDLEAEGEDQDDAKDGYLFLSIYSYCFLEYLYIVEFVDTNKWLIAFSIFLMLGLKNGGSRWLK